jgi:hypothetical protein
MGDCTQVYEHLRSELASRVRHPKHANRAEPRRQNLPNTAMIKKLNSPLSMQMTSHVHLLVPQRTLVHREEQLGSTCLHHTIVHKQTGNKLNMKCCECDACMRNVMLACDSLLKCSSASIRENDSRTAILRISNSTHALHSSTHPGMLTSSIPFKQYFGGRFDFHVWKCC